MRVWLDGRIIEARDATISVFDRGFLFGDGVYEVVRYFNGVGTGLELHEARLGESLRLTRILGVDPRVLRAAAEALLADLGTGNATVYFQITRGAGAERQHLPTPDLKPTVFAYAVPTPPLSELKPQVIRGALVEDRRWSRCEIKTLSLQGNILHMMEAAEQGADEAVLHRDGLVGEGTGSNVFANVGSVLVTPPVDSRPPILHGVMRSLILDACAKEGIPHAVRPLSVVELRTAHEIFVTGSKRMVAAFSHLDGIPLQGTSPGPRTVAVHEALVRLIGAP